VAEDLLIKIALNGGVTLSVSLQKRVRFNPLTCPDKHIVSLVGSLLADLLVISTQQMC